jgi:hypothetical protein
MCCWFFLTTFIHWRQFFGFSFYQFASRTYPWWFCIELIIRVLYLLCSWIFAIFKECLNKSRNSQCLYRYQVTLIFLDSFLFSNNIDVFRNRWLPSYRYKTSTCKIFWLCAVGFFLTTFIHWRQFFGFSFYQFASRTYPWQVL